MYVAGVLLTHGQAWGRGHRGPALNGGGTPGQARPAAGPCPGWEGGSWVGEWGGCALSGLMTT